MDYHKVETAVEDVLSNILDEMDSFNYEERVEFVERITDEIKGLGEEIEDEETVDESA